MAQVTLPEGMPSKMKRLPRDEVGRPVPWFVPWIDGKPDFRMMDGARLVEAIRGQLCFICGNQLHRVHGSNKPKGTFVAGPMCVINRTSAEPPHHHECAEWSTRACPFLTKPAKVRRHDERSAAGHAAGIMIERNPGVTALIECRKWTWYKVPDGMGGQGILFDMMSIDNISWMTEGRRSTPEEVLTSIDTGLPALVEMASMDDGGMKALSYKTRNALRRIDPFDPADYPTIQSVLAHLP